MTLAKIENVKPNPMRDFELYPISSDQVDMIASSIEKSTMWAALPAREVDGEFELAAGHHRLEALRKIGATEVELKLGEYTDDDMARIMVNENMTQRGGSNFGAQIEAVAAVARNMAKRIMEQELPEKPETDEPEVIKAWESMKRGVETSKGNILKGKGVGRDAIVKELEGSVTAYTVGQAVKVLKETGQYARVLKGIIPPKDLKMYKESDPKVARAYTAIASFDKASLGVAFMNAAKGADSKTAKQYISIAAKLRNEAGLEGKALTTGSFTAVLPKVETSSGDDNLSDLDKQVMAEMDLKRRAINFAVVLSGFLEEYPSKDFKLVNDFEWPEQISAAMRKFNAYEISEEETVATTPDSVEEDNVSTDPVEDVEL